MWILIWTYDRRFRIGVIAQISKFIDLSPAMLVYSAILKRFLVMPEEEGQMLALSCDVVLCHCIGKGTKKYLELYLRGVFFFWKVNYQEILTSKSFLTQLRC